MKYKIREFPDDWKKVNLGCNQIILPGWINVDIHSFEGVDLVANLEQSWPWKDDSIHYIRAFDIVEHLADPIHTMNEAWRVLDNGGILEIWVPSTDGRGAFQDPTHKSFWNCNSFLYYSKTHHGQLYPSSIHCDFEWRTFDTNPNPQGVIWTWALGRVIKDGPQKPAIEDKWYNALSSMDPKGRIVPGYEGRTLGTTAMGDHD
ncbi:MAG: methyltransferase domain-containing protein [Deltaproteobacteria bacterium]|nr:methyltransferase domain-containing protein [Deltaproteobacteria bacterium]